MDTGAKAKKKKKRFEILDHTADIGLIVYGEDLKTLFENAAEAFFQLITDLKRVRQKEERKVELQGESLERLMVDWLNELLYLRDVENLLFKKFEVTVVGEEGLKAKVKGEVFKTGVHVIKTGVKAVTHHQIQVKREDGGWKAQVILDL
ncbi:MAG: archease [Deltaproteobacteria bacterium]|nr:archease [Deltaproteobacteria bacterium]